MTLTLTGVGYRYAGSRRPSLLDIDLELREGTVVGLVGASESGKTTLCLVASGLAPRTVGGQVRGRITLDGEDVDAWPMHRLSERIGIGFANPATQLSQVAATVFEEVAFGPMNLAVARDEVIERTWSALETLGIAELAERDPQRLSGGQQQLVAVARAVIANPTVILADEPTGNLHSSQGREIMDLFTRLNKGGTTIIQVTHSEENARYGNRVIQLKDGWLVD
jgi:energy-coupling factor transporter ATP-binding protein EcfA2